MSDILIIYLILGLLFGINGANDLIVVRRIIKDGPNEEEKRNYAKLEEHEKFFGAVNINLLFVGLSVVFWLPALFRSVVIILTRSEKK